VSGRENCHIGRAYDVPVQKFRPAQLEKFAEKSRTYLHPDHEVTDVVVEGLARHIEEVGKPLCPCNF